jgi:hypothetical protein
MEVLSFTSHSTPKFGMTNYGKEGLRIDRDIMARECLIFT